VPTGESFGGLAPLTPVARSRTTPSTRRGGPTIDGSRDARLVADADAELRRIERELHDGPQQHLVALVVNLELARQLADTDLAAATTLLDEIAEDARETLEGLRALAARIYPPLLLDRGLGEALKAAAAAASISTTVESTRLQRHAPEVEATAYRCCVDALDDAARRHARHASIRAWSDDGTLCFEIGDDGDGGPAAGTALQDRVGALGGRIAVTAEPEHGARVSGAIPTAP